MGDTAVTTRANTRRLNQIEVASTAIEALRFGDPDDFGLPYTLAPAKGFMRIFPAGEDTGGVAVGFVPVSWQRVNVKLLVVGNEMDEGTIRFQTMMINGVDTLHAVDVEDVAELMLPVGIHEVELMAQADPITYSSDMAAVPIFCGRNGAAVADDCPDDLDVIGITFRKV